VPSKPLGRASEVVRSLGRFCRCVLWDLDDFDVYKKPFNMLHASRQGTGRQLQQLSLQAVSDAVAKVPWGRHLKQINRWVKLWPATFATIHGSFGKRGLSAILKREKGKATLSMASGAKLESSMRFAPALLLGLLPDRGDIHESLGHYSKWIGMASARGATQEQQMELMMQCRRMQESAIDCWGEEQFEKKPKFAAHRQIDFSYLGATLEHQEEWGEAFWRLLKRAFRGSSKREPMSQIARKLSYDAAVQHLTGLAAMADAAAAYAAANGKLHELEYLVGPTRDGAFAHVAVKGRDAATDSEGTALLSLAARGGHASCVELLLKSGAEADRLSHSLGVSALVLACVHGNLACVQLLLDAKADRKRAWRGRTALQWAVRRGHLECARRLSPEVEAAAAVVLDPGEVSSEPLESSGTPFDPRRYERSSLALSEIPSLQAKVPELAHLPYWLQVYLDGGERKEGEGERTRPKKPKDLSVGLPYDLTLKNLSPAVRFCKASPAPLNVLRSREENCSLGSRQ
jgi:hypothetical protein